MSDADAAVESKVLVAMYGELETQEAKEEVFLRPLGYGRIQIDGYVDFLPLIAAAIKVVRDHDREKA